jgi:hypothetical protein
MAELKTKPTDASVQRFLDGVEDERKRADAYALLELMGRAAGAEPKMWGDSIVGFGQYHYKYASGHEGDAPLTGFSPRKQNLTVYITSGFDRYGDLLQTLGKYKTGKVCLYIKRLADVDLAALEKLVRQSVEHMIATN